MSTNAAAYVVNPDGTPAAGLPVVPPDSDHPVSAKPQMHVMDNPFDTLDATAQNELEKMRRQDTADRQEQFVSVQADVIQVHQEANAATITHATYASYNAQGGATDDHLRAAINVVDAAVQPAINTAAAGGPTSLEYIAAPANANDWLTRLKAQDDAVKAAVEQSDAAFRKAM